MGGLVAQRAVEQKREHFPEEERSSFTRRRDRNIDNVHIYIIPFIHTLPKSYALLFPSDPPSVTQDLFPLF